jgi:ethanolamine utilization protein EutA
MDIGGGTANLALIREGKVTQTGCLNVGGRLIQYGKDHRITYVSPVLSTLCGFRPGDSVQEADLEPIVRKLTEALEMAAGLREPSDLLTVLTTPGTEFSPPEEPALLSFSGGVADCIESDLPWDHFGDIGPTLGRCIRRSSLCKNYVLGRETIRATVIGAGCHSAQLSGSTVFHRNIPFPLQNLPVLTAPAADLAAFLRREVPRQETTPVIALPPSPQDYSFLASLADLLAAARLPGPLILCMEQDMAKALGQLLALRLPRDFGILCIDRVRLSEGSYLDVGSPIGPALPVVVKTIVFSK